jgi:hypothetical protein
MTHEQKVMNAPAPAVVVRWITSGASPAIASIRIRVLSVIRSLRNSGVNAALMTDAESPCDVAVFCKTYRPADISLARRLKQAGVTIVFDLCDNHFLIGGSAVPRLREMMALADAWVFSTPALQEITERHLTERRPSRVIPDAVESEQGSWETNPIRRLWNKWKCDWWVASSGIRSQPPDTRLVWFGNHAGSVADSGMVHLENLKSRIEEYASRYGATLTIVSNSRRAYRRITRGWKIRTFYFTWNISTFLRVLRMHAVALLPFTNSEFNVVKSNNRLALSLFHGVAVVADEIPSYREFADCTILGDWSGVEKYLSDAKMRKQHVEAGRAIVAAKYMPENIGAAWLALVGELGARRSD